jgi:hypothetical protein
MNYHTIEKIIPPEAFHPYFKQRNTAITFKALAIFNLLSIEVSGRKGMSRFRLRTYTILKIKAINIVTNKYCTIGIPSCLAIRILIHRKIGEKIAKVTAENSIFGS